MGKKVIPEQVSYFCDVCGSNIHESRATDFVIIAKDTGYDHHGHAVGGTSKECQLCGHCKGSFQLWLKDNSGTVATTPPML